MDRLRRIASAPVTSPCAAALLAHLARTMLVSSEVRLAPMGMRPRHLVALTVLREHGGIPQQTLASMLRIDGRNVVGLLNELEADGLIARRRAAADRRRHIVDLTADGKRALAAAETAVASAEDEVLAALDTEQRATLYSLLQQATANEALDPNVGIDDGTPSATGHEPERRHEPRRRRAHA